MRSQAAVAAQANRYGLMTAVHRDEVQVHVDDEVALDGAAVDFNFLAELRGAEKDHVVFVLGVVVVKLVGPEFVEDPIADDVPHFEALHAAVDARGDDDFDVVDGVVGQQGEHDGENALANIGAAHRWQRQRDVVDRDAHLHARAEQRVERLAVLRVVNRVANGRVGIFQRLDGRLRIKHARTGWKIDLNQSITGKEGARLATRIEGDKARMAHDGAGLFAQASERVKACWLRNSLRDPRPHA